MKKLPLILCLFCGGLFAEEDGESNQPTIFADISQAAKDNAVSFDGVKMIAGLLFCQDKVETSLAGASVATNSERFDSFGAVIGAEYAKTVKEKFLLGINVLMSITKCGKKNASWGEINSAYEQARGASWGGDRYASVKTQAVRPSILLKLGYQLKSYESMIALNVGVEQVKVKHTYSCSNYVTGQISKTFNLPALGISIERKINSKFGARFEIMKTLTHAVNKSMDLVQHKAKLGSTSARVVMTYTPGR